VFEEGSARGDYLCGKLLESSKMPKSHFLTDG